MIKSLTPIKVLKTLGSIVGWNLTNLQIQKILYLINLFYLGRTGKRLINEDFEAWDYGVVLPSLYKEINFFGSDPVLDIFKGVEPLKKGEEGYDIIEELGKKLSKMTVAQLVSLTHNKQGAWAMHYDPISKNNKISQDLILKEYKNLYGTNQKNIN